MNKVFKIRDGPHLQDKDFKAKNFCFPPENQMRFDNPVVGFIHKPGRWCGVNVIMKDGQQSQLPLNILEGQGYSKVLIWPQNAQVRRVVMKGDAEFGGVIFYGDKGKKLLEAGHVETNGFREFKLEDNECIVGVKSKLLPPRQSPRCEDLQFVIGYLE